MLDKFGRHPRSPAVMEKLHHRRDRYGFTGEVAYSVSRITLSIRNAVYFCVKLAVEEHFRVEP